MGYLSIPRPKDIENELTQLVKESRTGRTLDEGGNFQQRDWLLSKELSDGVFFCSVLLECDLLAKKVPGRAPFSQHNIFRNWT